MDWVGGVLADPGSRADNNTWVSLPQPAYSNSNLRNPFKLSPTPNQHPTSNSTAQYHEATRVVEPRASNFVLSGAAPAPPASTTRSDPISVSPFLFLKRLVSKPTVPTSAALIPIPQTSARVEAAPFDPAAPLSRLRGACPSHHMKTEKT